MPPSKNRKSKRQKRKKASWVKRENNKPQKRKSFHQKLAEESNDFLAKIFLWPLLKFGKNERQVFS